jgi:hypothetical protein
MGWELVKVRWREKGRVFVRREAERRRGGEAERAEKAEK